ncbi:hypothetical protein BB561_005585 [Smittium simulii]|uniref:SCP2 domain-containing protein n=1 Tax=Smittium simulii TaxID=133385 RepID=A0A2T9Y9N7_9FUNG|nr:hypothetical protein BB561_005585 [Smittium simulii]
MTNFECAPIFENIKSTLQSLGAEEQTNLVEKGKGNFLFQAEKGDSSHFWLLCLETTPVLLDGGDKAALCKSAKPSVTLILDDSDMSALLCSKLNPTTAFMSGKLKLEGNMMLAMKLQPLLATFAAKTPDTPAAKTPDIPAAKTQGTPAAKTLSKQLLQTISTQISAANAEQLQQLKDKIDSVIQFDLRDSKGSIDSFTLNLSKSVKAQRNNSNIVLQGPANSHKLVAKLTLELLDKDFLGMMNRKLSGQAAYIQGKLKLIGDIFLAMKLDSVFKLLGSTVATKSKL